MTFIEAFNEARKRVGASHLPLPIVLDLSPETKNAPCNPGSEEKVIGKMVDLFRWIDSLSTEQRTSFLEAMNRRIVEFSKLN